VRFLTASAGSLESPASARRGGPQRPR
jgi:hypothetical protein